MKLTDPYAGGVLDETVHARLVASLDFYARDARIDPEWICTSMVGLLSEGEINWVKRFRFHRQEGRTGLCLQGEDWDLDMQQRMGRRSAKNP
jgi:hypothetical protein